MKKNCLLVFFCILIIFTNILIISCTKKNQAHTSVEYKEFQDDTGRILKVPTNIERVVVSGRIAQSIVFALSPDCLVAIAEDWSSYEKTVIDEKYLKLPMIGRIFGSTNLINKEMLLSLNADIIIDIGQKQDNIKETFTKSEEELGIPIVHLTLTEVNLGDVYKKLALLLNKETEAEKIIRFIDTVETERQSVFLKTEKKKALFVTGQDANRVLQKGSYFSSSIDLCTDNIASFDGINKNKYAFTINKEDLIKLNPEVLIFSSLVDKTELLKNDAITSMTAFKNSSYYFFPHIPYENMGFPPGPSEIFGIIWILSYIYSEYTTLNYDEMLTSFYSLFFHKTQNI